MVSEPTTEGAAGGRPAAPGREESRRAATEGIVRDFLAARAAGELDRARSLMSASIRWHSPVHGVVSGRDAVCDALAGAFRETRDFESTVERLVPHANLVVAFVRNKATKDDAELDSLQVLVFRVEDGIDAVHIVVDDPDEVRFFWEHDRGP